MRVDAALLRFSATVDGRCPACLGIKVEVAAQSKIEARALDQLCVPHRHCRRMVLAGDVQRWQASDEDTRYLREGVIAWDRPFALSREPGDGDGKFIYEWSSLPLSEARVYEYHLQRLMDCNCVEQFEMLMEQLTLEVEIQLLKERSVTPPDAAVACS